MQIFQNMIELDRCRGSLSAFYEDCKACENVFPIMVLQSDLHSSAEPGVRAAYELPSSLLMMTIKRFPHGRDL